MNQEKLEKETQSLRLLFISLRITEGEILKEEPSSVKAELRCVKGGTSSVQGEIASVRILLTQLLNLNKTQATALKTHTALMETDASQTMQQQTQPCLPPITSQEVGVKESREKHNASRG